MAPAPSGSSRMARTVVVTGSAGGIGSALRSLFEGEGHRVVGFAR